MVNPAHGLELFFGLQENEIRTNFEKITLANP